MQGDHITLKKNDGYFESGKPYLDGIDFKFLLVDQSRIDALQLGRSELGRRGSAAELSTLKSDPSYTYVTSATAGIPDYLALNTTQAPFDNKLVRQAVYWALDRTRSATSRTSAPGKSGIEEVPTGSTWFDGTPLVTPDTGQGEVATPAGRGRRTALTVEYLGLPQYPELLKTGEVMQQQLEAVGIKMNIKQVDVGVWFNAFIKRNYQITSAYQERTIDPDNFYALVIHTGGDINTTGLFEPAGRSTDRPSAYGDRRSDTVRPLQADPADRLRRRADRLRPLRDDQLSDAARTSSARPSTRRSSSGCRTSDSRRRRRSAEAVRLLSSPAPPWAGLLPACT